MKYKVRICLSEIPPGTPCDSDFFLAGEPNNWKPDVAAFRFQPGPDNQPILEIEVEEGFQYLITRVDLDNEEAEANGRKKRARYFDLKAGRDQNIIIEHWRDQVEKLHTVTGELIFEHLKLPNHFEKRCLRILLPPDYHQSERRYPVLYMQDGQNLFDEYTSYAGEWQVDECLEDLYKANRTAGFIVVGIDNAMGHRLEEYGPWAFEFQRRTRGGQGKTYAAALVGTIKPYIDKNFRTLPERQHTAVIGSSLGGLISLYTALRYQRSIGAVAALSPSIAITRSGPRFKGMIRRNPRKLPQSIYLDMGTAEGNATTAHKAHEIAVSLARKRHPDDRIAFRMIEGANHSEAAWSARFGKILAWLFPEHVKSQNSG